jgi:hypothetical protein
MVRQFQVAAATAAVFIMLAGGVSGCAYVKSPSTPAAPGPSAHVIPAEVRSSDTLESLLHYGELLYSMPAESVGREYAAVKRRFASDASAPNHIRLALLLSCRGSSVRDDARAREHLREVLRDAGPDWRPYHDLARFLLSMLDDRQRLESALADERQKLEKLKAIEQETGKRIPPKPIKGQ